MSDDADPTPAWWRNLADAEVADWMARQRLSVALCLDATHRWYYLDYYSQPVLPEDRTGYLVAAARGLAAMIHLLLDHGVEVLYLPLQVPLRRGSAYVGSMVGQALPHLLNDAAMDRVYQRTRVRTYGPWPPLPPGFEEVAAPLAGLQTAFAALSARTAPTGGPRLFFNLQFNPANPADYLTNYDQTTAVLEVVEGLQGTLGRRPNREELVAAFYHLDPGETLPPLDLLISGMMYDVLGQAVPPLMGGHEDVYFTVTSLLGLDRPLLRSILYDRLFLRPHPPDAPPTDYGTLPTSSRAHLLAWYATHRQHALGLGTRHPQGDFWYPRPPSA